MGTGAKARGMYPDAGFSIERLSAYCPEELLPKCKSNMRKDLAASIDYAMGRPDELWNGNFFDNGDNPLDVAVERLIKEYHWN